MAIIFDQTISIDNLIEPVIITPSQCNLNYCLSVRYLAHLDKFNVTGYISRETRLSPKKFCPPPTILTTLVLSYLTPSGTISYCHSRDFLNSLLALYPSHEILRDLGEVFCLKKNEFNANIATYNKFGKQCWCNSISLFPRFLLCNFTEFVIENSLKSSLVWSLLPPRLYFKLYLFFIPCLFLEKWIKTTSRKTTMINFAFNN